jgi:hypothetical protein
MELTPPGAAEFVICDHTIEFLFRDSKQFTGLLDCQARAASALDFHFNASLATLNLVRAEDLCMPQGQEPGYPYNRCRKSRFHARAKSNT